MCGDPDKGPNQGVAGLFAEMYNETLITNVAKLVSDMCKRWNLPIDRKTIRGHYEIWPGGRTDPGSKPGCWDWDYFLNLVRSYQ